MIEVMPGVAIPDDELRFTASRSGGPGGQHVNKVSSRITLRFDVQASPSLTDGQKRRIATRLATRMTRRGVLVMHCGRHRSQAANRSELVQRFETLLREALKRRRPRKRTRPPGSAVERRLEEKKRRGSLKRVRSRRPTPEE